MMIRDTKMTSKTKDAPLFLAFGIAASLVMSATAHAGEATNLVLVPGSSCTPTYGAASTALNDQITKFDRKTGAIMNTDTSKWLYVTCPLPTALPAYGYYTVKPTVWVTDNNPSSQVTCWLYKAGYNGGSASTTTYAASNVGEGVQKLNWVMGSGGNLYDANMQAWPETQGYYPGYAYSFSCRIPPQVTVNGVVGISSVNLVHW